MNNEKRKEKYKLMKKLLISKFDVEKLKFREGNLQVDLKMKNLCTANICLCIAIAKRTKASVYLKDSNFVFYIANDKPASHYILWADKHIKFILKAWKEYD